MDPPPEQQTSSKVTEASKSNSENDQNLNGKFFLKNTNSIKNNEPLQKQTVRSESIGTLKPFQYSLDSSHSLNSHFSAAYKIPETKEERDASLRSDGQINFNQNSHSSQKVITLIEPNQKSSQEGIENIQKGNLIKLKPSQDALEPNLTQQPIKENKNQLMRKSYTFRLNPISDQNDMQNPKRNVQKNQLSQQTNQQSKEIIQSNEKNSQTYPQKDGKSLQSKKNQAQIQKPMKSPIVITQKNKDKKCVSPQLPSPRIKKKANQQLQIRRIPSDLYESYDQLLLTVNKNNKILNKDNIISPIKLKQKHNHNLPNKKSKQNDDYAKQSGKRPNHIENNLKNKSIDQQLLVQLPILDGYCQLKTESSHIFETKYIINKNTIFFQTFKKIVISGISKIKLIEKEDKQITIKITYQPELNSKNQNFLINLLTESSETNFSQSYQFFSQIILRKLLLMKLQINQLNEKYEIESPIKSPQSSPLNSPMILPSVLPRKASQNTQNHNQGKKLFESNLYKKSTFFNSWQKKYFALTNQKLLSYSTSPINSEKQKTKTELTKTSEIWTRFELTYGYLVIKMWQSKIQKFQIGIPLCDFTNPQGKNNWLYGLSKNILFKKLYSKQQKVKKISFD